MKTLYLIFACACFAFTYVSCEEEELNIEILYKPEDCEEKTKDGDGVSMHYTGSLHSNGQVFDTSHKRGEPFKFTLGKGDVIKGWDQGLLDMCVAERRKLTIPPHLGYGDKGAGSDIPGGATLVFEVELIDIEEAQQPTNVFKQIDVNNDNQLSTDEVSDFLKKQMPAEENDLNAEQSHNELIADIFGEEDKDKDGVISFEEFSGPKHDEL